MLSLSDLLWVRVVWSVDFVFRWFEVGCAIWADEPNWCEPNQSTYRQRLPKVCLQHFHGQDEDWFRIIRTVDGRNFWWLKLPQFTAIAFLPVGWLRWKSDLLPLVWLNLLWLIDEYLCPGFIILIILRLVCYPTKEKWSVYNWINSHLFPEVQHVTPGKSIILASWILTSQKSIMWWHFFPVTDITTLFAEKRKAATRTWLVDESMNSEKIWLM